MKKGLTELVFILDRSGSMGGLENDTIGGYNSMLNEQKAVDGECFITTVLFDNNYVLLHDRIDIKAVSAITQKEYYIGGSTALIDAIGKTIDKIGNAQKHTTPEYRAERVMVVIITDGEENSSREYSTERVKEMIERQKNRYGWEFVFLGANIDSIRTSRRLGIRPDRTADYVPDGEGTALNFRKMNEAVARFREDGTFDSDAIEAIRRDMAKRGKK